MKEKCNWVQEYIPDYNSKTKDLKYVYYSKCGTCLGPYPANFDLSTIDINYCPKCGEKIELEPIIEGA